MKEHMGKGSVGQVPVPIARPSGKRRQARARKTVSPTILRVNGRKISISPNKPAYLFHRLRKVVCLMVFCVSP